MMKVGLTGGIGSGKTLASEIFRSLGVPVFNSDTYAKEILEKDSQVRLEVQELFGNDVFTNGIINRKAIGDIVFTNPEKLAQLNSIIHPRVFLEFENWCTKNNKAPYIIKEAAILFESGADKGIDQFIVVTAPIELRIDRVVSRDGISAEAVKNRMAKQWPEKNLVAKANYIIQNDGEHLLIPQVISIHERLV